jgi:hypothetical protein
MRILTLAALALLLPAALAAQTPADTAGVRQAALDYIEGWYTGDAARMERSLHPELVKRIVSREGGAARISGMTAADLVGSTRNGGGRNTPAERRRTDVEVQGIFGNAATARIDATDWVDFLHLARIDGQWRIVNVLWELRPRGGGGGSQ